MGVDILNILSQVMTGMTVLALMWLAARAARQHIGWGLAVLLFSPVSAALFGMRHWPREKLPLLTYAVTLTVTVGLLLALFNAWGGWALVKASRDANHALQSHTLTYDDADAFMKASLSFNRKSGIDYRNTELQTRIQRALERKAELAEIEAEAAGRDASAGPDNRSLGARLGVVPEKKTRFRLVYRTIKVADAHRYVGATVKVTRRNVEEKEYRLTGATPGTLQFMQKKGRGHFSFAFNKRDIDNIRVLMKEPY